MIFKNLTSKAMLLFATVLFSGSIAAQNVQITSLSFPPPAATSCTNTFLTVNTTVLCINANFTGSSVTVVGTTITVDVNYSIGPICLGAIGFPVQNVNMGMIAPGTYTVVVNGTWNGPVVSTMSTSLTVTSCCPSASSSFTFPNDTICVGDSVFYTNTSTGSSQEWFENGTSVSLATDYGKRYNTPGMYEIMLVVNGTGCSDTSMQDLFVSALPIADLGPDTSYCMGGSIVLDATLANSTYLWQDNSTSRTFTVTSPGTYSVTVDRFSCTSNDTVEVGVWDLPVVNLGDDTVICVGETLILDATLLNASYLWQNESTGPTFFVTDSGTYRVIVTDENGCMNQDEINVDFDTCAVGIKDNFLSNELVLFPNPADDKVFLKLNVVQNAAYAIEIRDLTGRLVAMTKGVFDPSQTPEIDISALKSGTYFVQLNSNESNYTTTLIKK